MRLSTTAAVAGEGENAGLDSTLVMLAAAPPDAMQRAKHGLEGDFDLLVIDEAPWFNLIPNEPVGVPIEWFSPEWWAARTPCGSEHQGRSAIELLAMLHSMFVRLPTGEIDVAEFTTSALRRSDMQAARRNIWKFKADLRGFVKPGSKLRRLAKAIEAVTPRNWRVLAVV